MVTDDSEIFRQDNLEPLVNFLPVGTAMKSDRYIETQRRLNVVLCQSCKKRWFFTTTPGHTAEAITRFGRTVYLTSQHQMFIAFVSLKESLGGNHYADDDALQYA